MQARWAEKTLKNKINLKALGTLSGGVILQCIRILNKSVERMIQRLSHAYFLWAVFKWAVLGGVVES